MIEKGKDVSFLVSNRAGKKGESPECFDGMVRERNRRASNALSPVLIHFLAPHGKLYQRLLALEQVLGGIPPIVATQQHPGSRASHHGIPPQEWPNVVRRVREHHNSLRQVAADYGVSHETIRRILRTCRNHRAG
jgi:hypothetical protein